MIMKKSVLFTVVLGLLFSSSFFGCEHKKESAESVLQKLAKITPAEAKTLALKNANGEIIEGGLELENGLLIYSYDVQMPDKVITEIQINAKDGSVVLKKTETALKEAAEVKESKGIVSEKEGEAKTEAASGEEKAGEHEAEETAEAREKSGATFVGTIPITKEVNLNSLAKISENQAKASALKLAEGKVEQIKLENENGYLVYTVRVKYKGDEFDVLVDAGNAKVLGVEGE